MRERKASHRLIETFMVLANEEISRTFHRLKIPFVYRVHEPPSETNRADLRILFKKYGIDLAGGEFSSKDLSEAYRKLKAKPNIPPIEKSLLSKLSKACYSEKPLGHFGLALDFYSHFTSPIRRYPDLQIHRIIKERIRGKLDGERLRHYSEILPVRSRRNSETERRAESLEREIESLEAARFMEKEVGKEFDGVVVGNSRYAYYVRIPNGIEGAVFLGKGGKEPEFPEFGTAMRVKLVSVERQYGRIDFVPVKKTADRGSR
ncbi:MAG: ribonuclease [Patescibacteria group bacterium]|nr:ribonuclease [Patescibacteria group bacterium]